jgi:FMN phosphatase YigB (HAD superfamily)
VEERDRAVLWDLDGTLYRSLTGYRYFARCVAEALAPTRRAPYLARVEQYLAGTLPDGWTAFASDWGAVVGLALYDLDGDEERLHAVSHTCFARVRTYLLHDAPDVGPNPVLTRFLKAARRWARMAVVSNGPLEEARPLLKRLGIEGYFDLVLPEAGKPEGLLRAHALLAELSGGMPIRRTLSVGDNWANDILPALAQGWEAAYVLPLAGHPDPGRSPTWQAARLEGLLPDIAHWLVEDRDRDARTRRSLPASAAEDMSLPQGA